MSGSPPTKKLIRQNTDVSESDTSECFTTPPTSPRKERALSPAQKSPVSWNSNPLYKTSQSSSAGSSPSGSPTRSQSFRSTFSSFGAESSPLGSPTNRRSLQSTSKSSSVGSPTGTSSHFTFSKPTISSTFGSRFSPPTKCVQSVNNKSSVFSQQSQKSSVEPPCLQTRKDSITKARKNSKKLDAENMLYGAKDTIRENGEDSKHVERSDSFNKENRPKEVKLDLQSKRKGSPIRSRTSSFGSNKEDNDAPVNGKIKTSDKDGIRKDRVALYVNTDSKTTKNYLDGFLMDAPDNTLIKPSKLRESMRRNRARRAQTAPVEREDVDKALEEIDRKWGKPERNAVLSHLPLADRLAFRKMRSEREQNNNEINRLLKKEMSSNIAVSKVLTTSTSSNVPSDDNMITPITTSANSNVFESPAITPVLHLSSTTSTSPTRTPSSPKHTPGSPPQFHTSRSEPLSPKLPTPPNNQVSPDQQDVSALKDSGASEALETKRRWQNGRSYSLDDHVSIYKMCLCSDNA